jgi:hypothetical protein
MDDGSLLLYLDSGPISEPAMPPPITNEKPNSKHDGMTSSVLKKIIHYK